MTILVAAPRTVLRIDPVRGSVRATAGLADARPVGLAADPFRAERVWCGSVRSGVFRSEDAGASWRPVGLDGHTITAVAASPSERDVVWAGTEPSEVWRSGDGGDTWERAPGLDALPSSGDWSFPPRPETHHVRWIACHPRLPGRLWVAIEAGALVTTGDGGRTWRDRVAGGPFDTHELAVDPEVPDTLAAAAGDGYFESHDGGATWERPRDGLEVGYLRSVAIVPGAAPRTRVVSAATHAHAAYVAGASDGRVYRRTGSGRWHRVTDGWPDPPATIAPLLIAGGTAGEVWAADERGVHRSEDAGTSWSRVAAFARPPHHLRGIAIVAG